MAATELIFPIFPRARSVRRRLDFGETPPCTTPFNLEVEDQKTQKKQARSFENKWGFKVLIEEDLPDVPSIQGGKFAWKRVSDCDSDMPSVYLKKYSHKCQRQACMPKKSVIEDSVSREMVMRSPSPQRVEYHDGAQVDLFLGVKTSDTPFTPLRSNSDPTPQITPSSSVVSKTKDDVASTPVVISKSVGDTRFRKPVQRRLTDLFRVRKRSRSLETRQPAKRNRSDESL